MKSSQLVPRDGTLRTDGQDNMFQEGSTENGAPSEDLTFCFGRHILI